MSYALISSFKGLIKHNNDDSKLWRKMGGLTPSQ